MNEKKSYRLKQLQLKIFTFNDALEKATPFLEPCSRDPWVGSSGVWLSAASKSPPRPGLASPGGAGCRNAARRRGEERGNYNIKWVLLLSYHSHGIETCHLNLNSKSRRQPFIFIIVKVVFQPIIIKKHFSSQNITVGETSDFCWPQNDKQWI